MTQFTISQSARITSAPRTSRAPRTPRAFTLIEVLIGIIVLGLGLLGLAAVFPAVVVQQRQANDAIEGQTLVESAKAYMRSSMALTARSVEVAQYSGTRRPPGLIRAIRDVPIDTRVPTFSDNGDWEIPLPEGNWLGLNSRIAFEDNGSLTIAGYYNDGNATENATYRIPLTDRLIPSVERGGNPDERRPDPRYVWDFMLRRNISQNADATSGDTLSAAVFVRRLDSTIRRDQGRTLAQMFEDRNRVVLPVSANRDNGDPASAGTKIYSPILVSDISIPAIPERAADSDIPVEFVNEAFEVARRRMIAQVGQKLVSRTGVVHTVTRVFENPNSTPPNALTITVDPPFGRNSAEAVGGSYRIWFTPQIPVAVEVFDVTVR